MALILVFLQVISCATTEEQPNDRTRTPGTVLQHHVNDKTTKIDDDEELLPTRPTNPNNTNIDIQSYLIHIKIDPETEMISGYAEIEFKVLAKDHGPLELDLVNVLTATQVEVVDSSKDQPLAFTHEDDRIVMDSTFKAHSINRIRIHYGGSPPVNNKPPWGAGFNWSQSPDGAPWVSVNNESFGAHVWFPCKNDPADEPERVRLEIIAPKDLLVAANGILKKIEDIAEDWKIHIWETNYPINNYDIVFQMGNYERIEDSIPELDHLKLVFYLLKEEPKANYYPQSWYDSDTRSYQEKRKTFIAQTKQYMIFLSKAFGPYPFAKEKLGIVMTKAAGMEHQTSISYGAGFFQLYNMDVTLLHELAHEWWGNNITAKNWEDIWLHEGFATYAEALYQEEAFGLSAYHKYVSDQFSLDHVFSQGAVVVKGGGPDRLVKNSNAIYPRGAKVLHGLRFLMGDEKFKTALKSFIAARPNPKSGLTTSAEFIDHCEKIHGSDLDWYFSRALYAAEPPKLVHDLFNKAIKEIHLQWATPDFNMPVQVGIYGGRDTNHTPELKNLTMDQNNRTLQIPGDRQYIIDPNLWIPAPSGQWRLFPRTM
ncbi:MAG: M1 family metallopeptidase [Bdellovibrionota bacterium]